MIQPGLYLFSKKKKDRIYFCGYVLICLQDDLYDNELKFVFFKKYLSLIFEQCEVSSSGGHKSYTASKKADTPYLCRNSCNIYVTKIKERKKIKFSDNIRLMISTYLLTWKDIFS